MAYEACFGKTKANEIEEIGQKMLDISKKSVKKEAEQREIIKLLQIQLEAVQNNLNSKYEFSRSVIKTKYNKINRTVKQIKSTNMEIGDSVKKSLNEMKTMIKSAHKQVDYVIDSFLNERRNDLNQMEFSNYQSSKTMKENEELKKLLAQSQDHLSRSQQQYEEVVEILENKEREVNEIKQKNRSLSIQKSNNYQKDNQELLLYKQKLSEASKEIKTLKQQLNINGSDGQMNQSLLYATETIKSQEKQIKELQNHIKELNTEIYSLGNQLQLLTVHGTKGQLSPRKVKFPETGNDRYCSFEDFQSMMYERNSLADQLDRLQAMKDQKDRQNQALEMKVKELTDKNTKTEDTLNGQIQDIKDRNQDLVSRINEISKINSNLETELEKSKAEASKNETTIRQKETVISSLTKENAKLIGQISVLTKFAESPKEEQFSLSVLLDSINLDPHQRTIISKVMSDSTQKNELKISQLEQTNSQSQTDLKKIEQENILLTNQISRLKSKTELMLNENKEKTEKIVNHALRKVEQKQKEINTLSDTLKIIQEESRKKDIKIDEMEKEAKLQVEKALTESLEKTKEISSQAQKDIEQKLNDLNQKQKEIELKQIEIDKLNESTKALQEENMKKDMLISELESSYKSKTETILKESNEKSDYFVIQVQKKLAKKQSEINNLATTINLLKQDNEKKDSQIASLGNEIKELQQTILKKHQQIEEFKGTLTKFEQHKVILEEKIKDINLEKEAEIKGLHKINENLTDKIGDLEKQASKFKEEIENLKLENKSIHQNNSKANKELEIFEEKARKSEKLANEAKSQSLSLTEKLEKVQDENKQLQVFCEQGQAAFEKNQELNDKLDLYQQAHHENKKKIKALIVANQQFEAKIKAKREQILQQMKLIDDLQKSSDELNRQKAALEEQLKSQNMSKNKVRALKKSLRLLEEERNELSHKLSYAEEEIIDMEKKIDQLTEATNSNESLKLQVSELNQSLQQKETEIAIKEAQITTLKLQQQGFSQIYQDQQYSSFTEQPVITSPMNFPQQTNQSQPSSFYSPQKTQPVSPIGILQSSHQPQMQSRVDISQLNNKIHDLQEKVNKKEKEITHQKSKINKLMGIIHKLDVSISKIAGYNNDDNSESNESEFESDSSSFSSGKQSPKPRTINLTGLKKMKKKLEKTEETKNSALKEIKKLTDEKQRLQDLLKKAEEEKIRFSNIVLEQKATIEKGEEADKSLMKEIKKLKDEKESIENTLRETDAERIKLLDSLSSQKNKIEKLSQENENYNRQIKDKAKEISLVTSELSDLKLELQAFKKTNKDIIDRVSEVSKVDKIEQIPDRILWLNEQVEKIKEALLLKNNEDVVEFVSNQAQQMKQICKALNMKQGNSSKAAKEIAKELEATKKMNNDFSRREQIFASLLGNNYSFDKIHEILTALIKLEHEMFDILGCNSSSEITEHIQILMKAESFIERTLGCSSIEEIQKEIVNLRNMANALERILNVEDYNEIIQRVKDDHLDIQKIEKSFAIDSLHASLQVFIQSYTDARKATNSDSFGEVFAKTIEMASNSKKMRQSLQTDNETLVQMVEKMRNTIKATESLIDSEFDGDLTSKVSELSARNKILKDIIRIFDPNQKEDLPKLINDIFSQMMQIKTILGSQSDEVVQVVSELQSQNKQLSDLLNVDNNNIIPCVAEMKNKFKKILDIYSDSTESSLISDISNTKVQMSKIRTYFNCSKSIEDDVIEMNNQMKAISDILQEKVNVVEAVMKQNKVLSKISEILSNPENIIEEIVNQKQIINRIFEVLKEPENILGEVSKQSQLLNKISDILKNPNNLVDEISNLTQILNRINEILKEPSNIVDVISTQTQTLNRINEILKEPSNLISEVSKQSQIIHRINEILKDPDDIVEEISTQVQTLNRINEILKEPDSIVDEISNQKQIVNRITEILKGKPDTIVEEIANQTQILNRINEIYRQPTDLVDDIQKQKELLNKISEILKNPENVIEEIVNQNHVLNKVSDIMKEPENLIEAISEQNQQIKTIKEMFPESNGFINEIAKLKQQNIKLNEILPNSDDLIGEISKQTLQCKKISELFPDSDNFVEDIFDLNKQIKQIGESFSEESPSIVNDVELLNKQMRKLTKLIPEASNNIVEGVESLVKQNEYYSNLLQKAKETIKCEKDEDLISSLKMLSRIHKILRDKDNKSNNFENNENNDLKIPIHKKVNDIKKTLKTVSSILPQFGNNNNVVDQTNKTVDLLNDYSTLIQRLINMLDCEFSSIPIVIEDLLLMKAKLCNLLELSEEHEQNSSVIINEVFYLKDILRNIENITNKLEINNNVVDKVGYLSQLEINLKQMLDTDNVMDSVSILIDEQNKVYNILGNELGNTIIDKVISIKQKEASLNNLISSVGETLNINQDINIEDEIENLVDDLHLKNSLLNSFESLLSNDWEPISINDLKKVVSINESPSKRKSPITKSSNDIKVEKIESSQEVLAKLKEKISSMSNQNTTEDIGLISSLNGFIDLYEEKTEIISHLNNLIDNSNGDDLPAKIANLVKSDNEIHELLKLGKSEPALPPIQGMIENLEMAEASLSLQTCELESLQNSLEEREMAIRNIQQLTNSNDYNSLIKNIYEITAERKELQRMIHDLNNYQSNNQNNSLNKNRSADSQLPIINHRTIPEFVQQMIDEKENLSEFQKQIEELLTDVILREDINKSVKYKKMNSFEGSNVDNLNDLIEKVQQLLDDKTSLSGIVDYIKDITNDSDGYLDQIQRLCDQENQIIQILETNENIPEKIANLSIFNKSASQLLEECNPSFIQDPVEKLAFLIKENQENQEMIKQMTQETGDLKNSTKNIKQFLDSDKQLKELKSIIMKNNSDDHINIIQRAHNLVNKEQELNKAIEELKEIREAVSQFDKSDFDNTKDLPKKLSKILSESSNNLAQLNEIRELTHDPDNLNRKVKELVDYKDNLDKNFSQMNLPNEMKSMINKLSSIQSDVNSCFPSSPRRGKSELDIADKITSIADKAKVLNEIIEIMKENDLDGIPDKIINLMEHSKSLSTIGGIVHNEIPSKIIEIVNNQDNLIKMLKQMLNTEHLPKTVELILKENKQIKDKLQKVHDLIQAENEYNDIYSQNTHNSSSNSIYNDKDDVLLDCIHNLIDELHRLQNEKSLITKILNTDQQLDEIKNLKALKDKLQQMFSRKDIIPEVQRLINTTENISKISKKLECPINEIFSKITSIKEELRRLNTDFETINELLYCNTNQQTINRIKKLVSLLNEPEDVNEEIENLQSTLKKYQETLSNKQNQEKTALMELQATMAQIHRITQTKTPKGAMEKIDHMITDENQLMSLLKLSDPSNILLKVEELISERAKISINVEDSEDLPQSVFNIRKKQRENEKLLNQIAGILSVEDYSQIPRVVAELCQKSKIVKSINNLIDQKDIDQLPEKISQLTQDSASLSIRDKEYDSLKHDYDDLCNFVKRLIAIIMDGHSPQKIRFPIPTKAKDKLIEFLRSFKKRSDRNISDIKLILKRANSAGYYDSDVNEAVNSIVDAAVAIEKQLNLEDMHEKTKSFRINIEKQKAQYDSMKSIHQKRIEELRHKLEEVQRKDTELKIGHHEEDEKNMQIISNINSELETEKRIHEELLRVITDQVPDIDFLKKHIPPNEMKSLIQSTKK
ncbi:hypothetical protein TRFO_38566 [Tritrichomonas foetus]|uniref:Uncharacterized protein n=1 Tax=Tritrichomonas foetus TaxID=1144522 RepID=A0A1J4JCF5_9EUKA|nr:hypothetical protein TRFO_38566 [Tritrichomonas foetus]|eukprot:OHS95331.1 hypothetical protein TRFO_38566 [Tritrichomonas foetus]